MHIVVCIKQVQTYRMWLWSEETGVLLRDGVKAL